jgi:phospholipid N-methyltransferase
MSKKNNYIYPEKITENFDTANFHIKYCLSFIKRYLRGNILEVGAGCGSFTRNYFSDRIDSLTLTEKDNLNYIELSKKYRENSKIKVYKEPINNLKQKYDVILYLHVLEHIKDDNKEIEEAIHKLNENGFLIIMVPAHQNMYSNLDKVVGHYRRYDIDFFQKKINSAKLENLKFLDSTGYFLYKINNLIFKKEEFPSKLKIFIWDKFFTPLSIILDFILMYKFGKCILAIYKK